MGTLLRYGIECVERGWVPDWITRQQIRELCHHRVKLIRQTAPEQRERAMADLIRAMSDGPIAAVPEKANEQHYELPAEFFALALGPRRKYSCCYWDHTTQSLAEAENRSLALTCEHAGLIDGHEVLELGCGWGSLSLFMAEQYPQSRITAVSNSQPQREFIESQIAERQLKNLRVLTRDMNEFQAEPQRFDRVVSVEMFEHMQNYEQLLDRVAGWLKPDGRLFVHIFCHRDVAYFYETEGDANWMGRHFFTGGLMPSADIFSRFPQRLAVQQRWFWDGRHYERTSNAWLKNLDARRTEALAILTRVYGPAEARRWWNRWRTFFLAVAEMFGIDHGAEWQVGHYLLEPTQQPRP
jgi:cyclopropane-fatty-acyl-phospholipid synthase